MVKGLILGLTVPFMRDNMKTVRNMEKETSFGLINQATMAISKIIIFMAWVRIPGQTAENT